MMKAGTQTGSLVNHLMSQDTPIAPEIGMGATILSWTDRNAGTIVKITPKQIHVQEDNAERTDSTERPKTRPKKNESTHEQYYVVNDVLIATSSILKSFDLIK